MKLQTQIPLEAARSPIDYNADLLLIGSCFAENIGKKFEYFKFQTLQNPLGVLFHPLAIEKLILNAINEETFTEKDIFFLNERWHCFQAHSELSDVNKDRLLQKLNDCTAKTNESLLKATHLVITLGTSWVYRDIASDQIVANCHKVPQKKFLKELLTVTEISESLQSIISLVKSVNPNAQIIFTVSPVRHLKDGFVQNQQSKSHLIAALGDVLASPATDLYYFPSYEIMMDELRDYRFYAEDMMHPSQLAIDCIWGKFQQVWVASEAQQIMKEVDLIQKGIQHRPFHPEGKQHQEFLQKLVEKQRLLQQKNPNIHF